MEKKPLRVAYNVFGVLAALTLLSVSRTANYMDGPFQWVTLSELVLLPLLAVLPIVTLFRKQAHLYTPPLYAAAVGYALSAKMVEFLLPKVNPDAWADYGRGVFGGAGMQTGVAEMFYTFPLALLSLLVAILLTVFYLRKKRKAEPALTATPAPDSDSAAPKNP